MDRPAFLYLRHCDSTGTEVVYEQPLSPDDVAALKIRTQGATFMLRPDVLVPLEVVTAGHVRFARELVEASKQYLAELERAYEHDQVLEDQANDDQKEAA